MSFAFLARVSEAATTEEVVVTKAIGLVINVAPLQIVQDITSNQRDKGKRKKKSCCHGSNLNQSGTKLSMGRGEGFYGMF